MNTPWETICGIELSVKRRRYGSTTYTWVYARLNEGLDQWVCLGDPWPSIRPKFCEVRAALLRELAGRVMPSYAKEAA